MIAGRHPSTGELFLEVAEARYAVLFDEFALDTSPVAGAGRRGGGRGCVRDYRALADEIFVTATCGRHRHPPWGVEGGRDGSRNEVRFTHADGRVVVMGKSARYRLERGEVAAIVTGAGGGWGDPRERPVEQVVEDVKDGYLSLAAAESEYGVVIDPVTLEGGRRRSE